MKNEKKVPALKLNKKTLRSLTTADLRKVAGGAMTAADDQANNCPGNPNGGGGHKHVLD